MKLVKLFHFAGFLLEWKPNFSPFDLFVCDPAKGWQCTARKNNSFFVRFLFLQQVNEWSRLQKPKQPTDQMTINNLATVALQYK